MNKFVISQSPHLHANNSVQKIMYMVIIALIPALAFSLYLFGIGALIVTTVSVVSAIFFEWIITKYLLHKKPTIWDGSAALTGLLLAFNVPSNLPIWIIIIGALVAIGIGKMSFGGLGQNPFNPAIVGRIFLFISFSPQMASWPVPHQMTKYIDAVTGETALGLVKTGLKNEQSISQITDKLPSNLDMFSGVMGGSIGELSAGLLILGGLFLLIKKVISWHIPVSVLATVFVFSGIFWLINPESYMNPLFQLLTGGLMLGAIFMATDYSSSPMSNWGKIIFGIGIGAITIIIRFWGAYPEGVSFAILIMNAFVPLIDRAFKPKLFGEIKKAKK